jgi:minimal PKS ketosynthase (KS/KS alpha)
MNRRIAISGIGVVAPCGVGKNPFWASLLMGASFVSREAPDEAPSARSTTFRAEDWFAADRDRWLLDEDRFVQFGVLAGRLAMNDAELAPPLASPHRAGAVSATVLAGASALSSARDRILRGERAHPADARLHHATAASLPSTVLAEDYGLGGPCTAFSGGCTAGLDALGLAFEHVRSGDVDLMLVGASEAPRAGRALAAARDGATRSFVPAEGAAALVVEDLDHAVARGARVYAEVLAFAAANARLRVLRDVVAQASLDPRSIDYVDVHGDWSHDAEVTRAPYDELLGPGVAIGSAAGVLGHPFASAGLMGIVAAIGAIKLSLIPHAEAGQPGHAPGPVGAALVTARSFARAHSAAVLRSVDRHE